MLLVLLSVQDPPHIIEGGVVETPASGLEFLIDIGTSGGSPLPPRELMCKAAARTFLGELKARLFSPLPQGWDACLLSQFPGRHLSSVDGLERMVLQPLNGLLLLISEQGVECCNTIFSHWPNTCSVDSH